LHLGERFFQAPEAMLRSRDVGGGGRELGLQFCDGKLGLKPGVGVGAEIRRKLSRQIYLIANRLLLWGRGVRLVNMPNTFGMHFVVAVGRLLEDGVRGLDCLGHGEFWSSGLTKEEDRRPAEGLPWAGSRKSDWGMSGRLDRRAAGFEAREACN